MARNPRGREESRVLSFGELGGELGGLWEAYLRDRSPELRNKLIEKYTPLVKRLAGYVYARMANNTVIDRDDLLGYGYQGLVKAVERFEPILGLRFVTYASQRIRGAMLDGMRQTDWVPRSERDAAKRGEAVP